MRQAIAELIALEPVRIRAIAAALVGLAISLGIDADEGTVLAAVDAILPIVTAVVIFLTARSKVTPVASLPQGNG